ncbi:hypothetical protein AB5N19_12874 [Seiridium cardinale]
MKEHQDKTALFMACEAGHIPMIQLLLKSGADPEISDINGKTPLWAACEKGDHQTVQVLLNTIHASNIINKPGPGGRTPLIAAARSASTNFKRVQMVKELVRHNADPRIQDRKGNNAFATGQSSRPTRSIVKQHVLVACPGTSQDESPKTSGDPPRFPIREASYQPGWLSENESTYDSERDSSDGKNDALQQGSMSRNDEGLLGVRQYAYGSPSGQQPLQAGPYGAWGSSPVRNNLSTPASSGPPFGDATQDGMTSTQVHSGATEPVERFLACPFLKANPFHYPECTSNGYRRVSDVKQHLRRNHYKPYCPRCNTTFDKPDDRDDHPRVGTDCNKESMNILKGMTDQQKTDLVRCPPSLNGDERGQWYHVFSIVFPDHQPPRSPYKESYASLALKRLEEFAESHHDQLMGNLMRFDQVSSILQTQFIQTVARMIMDQFLHDLRQPLNTATLHHPRSIFERMREDRKEIVIEMLLPAIHSID